MINRSHAIIAIILPILSMTSTSSVAEIIEKAAGTYENKGEYWQQVKISRAKKSDQFIGSFQVATRGCQGDVEMRGAAVGPDRILFSEKSDVAPGGVCNINVRFSRDFRSISVSHEYCGFSGAACDFNGDMKRKGKN